MLLLQTSGICSFFVEKLELQETKKPLVFISLETSYCFPIPDNWGGKVGGPGERKGFYCIISNDTVEG